MRHPKVENVSYLMEIGFFVLFQCFILVFLRRRPEGEKSGFIDLLNCGLSALGTSKEVTFD